MKAGLTKRGCSESRVREILGELYKSKAPVKSTTPKGLEGWRELHDPDIQLAKRDEATSRKLEKFIAGRLKSQGWFYVNDVAREAGISKEDWQRHRETLAHLMVEVKHNGSRKTTICHPSLVDEAREIAARG
jgi:hypothetical protein